MEKIEFPESENSTEFGSKINRETKDLIDNAPIGIAICRVGKGYKVEYISEGFCKIFEGDRRDLARRYSEDFTMDAYHQDRYKIRNAYENAVLTNKTCSTTYRILGKREDIKWISLSIKATKIDENDYRTYASYSDITDQIKAREELRFSESGLESVIEHAGIYFWEYDIAHSRSEQSKKSSEDFGIPRIVENFPQYLVDLGIVHKSSAKDFIEMHRMIREGVPVIQKNIQMVRSDGRTEWSNVKYTVVFDEAHRPVRAIGTGINVDEQVKLEQKYNEMLAFRNVTENQILASCRLNISSNLCRDSVSENKKLKEVGMVDTVDEFFHRVYENITDGKEEYKALFNRKNLLSSFKSGEKTVSIDHKYNIGDRYIWITSQINMEENPATGDVEGIIFSIDIDQEKINQLMLDKVAFYQYDYIMIIDAYSDTFKTYVMTRDKGISIPYSGVYSKETEEFIAKYILGDFRKICEESLNIQYMTQRLRECDSYFIYGKIHTDLGNTVTEKIEITYIDREREIIALSGIDVTDMMAAEQQKNEALSVALIAAKQASAAKTDFLSRMSHEIRTPMNAIIGMADIADQSIGDDEQIKDCIGKIMMSSKFLLALINDILDMNKIESGKILLKREEMRFDNLIENVNLICMSQAREKGVNYSCKVSPRVKSCYIGDRVKLQQVMINILSNGIKFTPAGGAVELEIDEIRDVGESATVRFTVKDNGCGISEDFIPHLFDPFTQEHSGNTSSYGGTGLGLSISKNLVALMNGHIEVKSRVGKGTQFTVSVDLDLCKENTIIKPQIIDEYWESSSEKNQKAEDMKIYGRRVLLVEDHPINIEVAKRLLEKKGVSVECAKDGRSAVEMFDRSEAGYYDAILMDIRMPVMDGLEAARAIRGMNVEKSDTVPIIAMTANAFDEDVEKSKLAGMNDHIAKPIDPQKLYRTLGKYFSEK